MAKTAKKKTSSDSLIVQNKKARHDYTIGETFVAGLSLEGWEVKGLRAGRANLTESFVQLHNGEAYLYGAHITPLPSASTHVDPEPARKRKLLLNRNEISSLIGAVERKGFTVVPLKMFWLRGLAKLEIGLAKGKKQHDKRDAERTKDWQREQQRVLKSAR